MTERLTSTDSSGPRGIDSRDPLIGKVLAERFRILDLIARGGMGKIYKAEQMPLGRIVALKVLAPAERRDDEEDQFRRRFEREASICSRLSHSNTVRVFDYGWTTDGIYYIAMEYIEGRTLHHLIKTESPVDAGRLIHMLRQICGSLSEAHKQGIVHRDLKPGNVLVTTQGDDRDFVKVVDFGLVKRTGDTDVTQAGLIVGSPMYMSPEQVRGEDVDHRTDIYALGVIAYVCLTGKRPFDRDTPIAVLMARMTSPPPKMREINPAVTVPASVEWVVMTCLQLDPYDRFASMGEVLRALRVCEAEVRGEPGGNFKMQLDNGKTVLPAEFSDPSMVSRSRGTPIPAMIGPDPITDTRSRTAIGAGLSLVALVAVAFLALIFAGLVGVAYIASRPPAPDLAAPIPAAEPVAAPALAVEPTPIAPPPELPVVAAPEPVAPVEAPPVAAEPPKPVAPKPKPQPKPVVEVAPPIAPSPPPTEEKKEWKVQSEVRNPFARP